MTIVDEIVKLYAEMRERRGELTPDESTEISTRLIFLLHERAEKLQRIIGEESGLVEHIDPDTQKLHQQAEKFTAEAIRRNRWLEEHESERGSEEWNQVFVETERCLAEAADASEKLARLVAQLQSDAPLPEDPPIRIIN